ncbi:MAG: NAD(P)/FAD-dependent oxidoreductase [Candidatus Hodgkinia cicadicola]
MRSSAVWPSVAAPAEVSRGRLTSRSIVKSMKDSSQSHTPESSSLKPLREEGEGLSAAVKPYVQLGTAALRPMKRKRANETSAPLAPQIKLPPLPAPKVNPAKPSTTKRLSLLPPFERTVIIGSGVAACTAASYCASSRPQFKPLVIAGPLFGGQLCSTSELVDWPGVLQTTTGLELLTKMHLQAAFLGVRLLTSSVEFVATDMWPYHVFTQSGHVIVANSIILATGRQRIGLNLPGEASLLGLGVFLNSPPSPYLFKGKAVIVVGTSRTAAWEALRLAVAARRVTIVCRKAKLSCGQDLQIALNRLNVNIMLNTNPVAYATKSSSNPPALCGLEVSRSGVSLSLQATAVVLATNITARTDIVRGLAVSDHGYVLTKHHTRTETNLPGIFAAGDIVKGNHKYALMAAASGLSAALAVQRFLSVRSPSLSAMDILRSIVTPRIT